MRTKNAFEYDKEHREIVYKFVFQLPKTTNQITKEIKSQFFNKISHPTVNRLLDELYEIGKIKRFKAGKITLWQK